MRLAPRAERDIEEIEDYLSREAGEAIAIRVVDNILEKLAKLDGFLSHSGTLRPELGSGVRSWPLGSYTAFYRESSALQKLGPEVALQGQHKYSQD
jgi:plasmid stabilization system protein ParE